MARAIDGDLLADYIRKIDMPFETKTTVLCTINTMPTIDPVQHGKWSDPLEGNDRAFQCSLCGGLAFNHGLLTACPYKYCPHCGARMDMDKE